MQRIFHDRVFTLLATIIITGLVAAWLFPVRFASFANLSQVLLNVSIDGIVATGMMLLMISGSFDLSVGSVVAFSAALAGYLMHFYQMPVAWAILSALLAAGIIGLINGYLIAVQGINPLIQTLAMMGIIRGAALMLAGSGIQGLPYWFRAIGQSRLAGVQMPVWYMAGTVILFTVLFNTRAFFRRYYFIGGNEKAALLSGIRVQSMKIYAFLFSALLAGVAGVLLASRLGVVTSSFGRGLELRVITAVILGGATLGGGVGKIPGALLGALFMGLVGNIMVIARVSGYWQDIIQGVILILAVWGYQRLKKD